jgi:hypothetical protein
MQLEALMYLTVWEHTVKKARIIQTELFILYLLHIHSLIIKALLQMYNSNNLFTQIHMTYFTLDQCFPTAGPWHQLYRAARGKYFIMEIFWGE